MSKSPAHPRRLPCLLLLFALMVGTVRSQVVAGEVRGFAGELAGAAVVRVFDAQTRRVGEVLTDQNGRFEFLGNVPIGSIEVQMEGVSIEAPVQNGGDRAMRVSFVGVRFFILLA